MVSLESLHEGIRRCTACSLACSREHAVPGSGPCPAVIMFVGEAPGREEDKLGLPFVGRSGKFLDWLFSTIGTHRAEFFITSSVKCRPPNNRRPEPCELQTCRELWLYRQIDVIKPRLVVCLGGVSSESLLGQVDLKALHGTVVERGGQSYFLTYHPAAGMRFPRVREAMLADFIVLRELILSLES